MGRIYEGAGIHQLTGMLTVKCAKCKSRVFKYVKIGQGQLIKCHRDRIAEDNAVYDGEKVLCPKCGNLIGKVDGPRIRLRRSSFVHTGHKH